MKASKIKTILYLCLGISLLFSTFVCAKSEQLPVPRFVSIRARKVNLHVGPGIEYPSEWTYISPGLPVEIIAEFDIWRQVRDPQGTTGWIQKSMLCGKRTAFIQAKRRKLYKDPEVSSRVVAYLDPGIIAKVIECRNDWCKLDAKGYKGWIKRRCIWGVYSNETKF